MQGDTSKTVKTPAAPAAPRVSPGDFIRQVRQEVAKVTWPSRKETLVTTAMVFVMSIAAAIFFFLVDHLLAFGVRQILGLGA